MPGITENPRQEDIVLVSTSRRRFSRWAPVAAFCALALASCGGDESAQEGAASGDAARPADSAAAQELVDRYTAPQDEWQGPDEAPPIVGDKTIGVVPCGMAIEGCARQARGAEEAAQVLGWRAIIADGAGDAQRIQNAISSLINRRVDAIYLASVNAEGFGDQLRRAEEAGIAVIASFASDPEPFGGLMEVGIDYEEAGRALAAFAATEGGGDAVVFDQEESPAVAARAVGFKKGLEEFGVGEVVEEQSVPNTQLGPPTVDLMSAILQRNPEGSFKWMYAGFDFMLTSMIQAAQRQGRTEVRGMSFDGNEENLEFIRGGNGQAADIGYPLEWAAWAVMDELNRHFNDEELVEAGIQFKLLTQENLPPEGEGYKGDLDYQARYRELWGL